MHPPPETLEQVASRVASRYARRCFWAERADLEQEARAAVYAACRTWEPALGPLNAYAHRAAVYALRAFTWRAGAPVSASHRPSVLAGLHRAPLEAALEMADAASPEAAVCEAEWQAQVRRAVEQVVRESVRGDASMVLEAVMSEDPPRVVAARLRVPVVRVHWILCRARRALRRSEQIYALHKEKTT